MRPDAHCACYSARETRAAAGILVPYYPFPGKGEEGSRAKIMGNVLLYHWSSFSSQKLASRETWHGVKKKKLLDSELGSNLDLALAMGMNLGK